MGVHCTVTCSTSFTGGERSCSSLTKIPVASIFSFHATFTPVQVSKYLKRMVRVGVVGYGALGRYLAKEVEAREGLELVWVWNRSPVRDLPPHLVLGDLGQCDKGDPDLIVEVAHPDVTKEFGAKFLEVRKSLCNSCLLIRYPGC